MSSPLPESVLSYHNKFSDPDKLIFEFLAMQISKQLTGAELKLWHAHPVWFLDGNPIVGYSRQKPGVRLMFWSGADFKEPDLILSSTGKFKDASIFYNEITEINAVDIKRWLQKSREIQWDYKNIVKRKGILKKLK